MLVQRIPFCYLYYDRDEAVEIQTAPGQTATIKVAKYSVREEKRPNSAKNSLPSVYPSLASSLALLYLVSFLYIFSD